MTEYSWLLELIDDCIDFVNNYDILQRELNILCFGASLTKGYTHCGLEYYPYSDTLKELIEDWVKNNNADYHQFGIKYKINVHNVGVDGECISDTMHDRLFNILNKSDIVFDLIIITGGINDIYCGYSVDKIWNNFNKMDKNIKDIDFMESASSVKQIYEMVEKYEENKDIKIVSVTITSFFKETVSMNNVRKKLNELIVNYCNESENKKCMILCDLNNAFPKFNKASKHWEKDGIHFTKIGYELFGKIIFQCINSWLRSKLQM